MEKSRYEVIMEQKTGKLLAGSLIYGILFAVLLYRNMSGIGIPVLMLVTCLFLAGFFRMFEMKLKKETVYYMTVMVLLGVSSTLTTSDFFIMFNWFGSIGLFFLILIHQFYEDRNWNFLSYTVVYLRMMFAPLGNLLSPFRALIRYRKSKEEGEEKKKSGYIGQVVLGIILAGLLLLVIFPLLFSGDMVFAEFIRLFTGNFRGFSFSTGWITLFLAGFILCFAVWQAFVNYDPDFETEEKEERPIQVAGITCISILTAVYLIFCAIQLGSLFFGHGMGLPDGYTYAEYARSGFFELLGVSIINLLIVLAVIHLFYPKRLMQRLLTVFSGCTYVMILSSGYRMCMYIEAYRFTLSRVLVLWGLCVLSFILAGVIVNVYKKDFPLFRYSAAVCAAFYLILSLSRPDEWMARYNLAYKEEWIESYDEIRYLFSRDLLLAVDAEQIQHLKGDPGNLIHYCQEVVDMYDNEPGWTYSIGEARAKESAERFLKEYGDIT